MSIDPAREARIAPMTATAAREPRAAQPAEPSEGPSAFQRVLHGIGREVERGEATVQRALGAGGAMSAPDLLALQAGVYRYSEAVDLAAKLVDRASSGVRTVVQGQT